MKRAALVFRCGALFAGASAALIVALAGTARAQSQAEIRMADQIASDGQKAHKSGDYQEALEHYTQAIALHPSAKTWKLIGDTYLAMSNWTEALEAYESALKSDVGKLSAADRATAEASRDKALAHFASVRVVSKAPGAEVIVDGGAPIALPMNEPLRILEGKHKFELRVPNRPPVTREVDVVGGTQTELEMAPEPAVAETKPPPRQPTPPPKVVARRTTSNQASGSGNTWQRPLGWTLIGTGAAAGLAAAGSLIYAGSIRGRVESDVAHHNQAFGENCEAGDWRLCVYDRALINRDADLADSWRDIGVGLTIGAGVAAATGVVLVALAPKSKARSSTGVRGRRFEVSAGVGPRNVSLAGRF